MCLVRASNDGEDDVYIRRVHRPARTTQTRITYSPRTSARETRTRVSQTYIAEAPRSSYVLEDRPRGQYLVAPPQHVGAHIQHSMPLSRDIPSSPPAVPMPPPPPPVEIVREKQKVEIFEERERDKDVVIEKKVEKKIEKNPPQPVESRLEVISIEHSPPNPRHSHSNVSRKHSRHGSRTSDSTRGDRREHDGIIVERERDVHTRRYQVDPARRSVPDYDTYRYIEAPPTKREVRYLEDSPRRSTGGIFRERERERVVVDNDSRRRREYLR